MKRAAGVVISALVFGLVAGASMVGVNVAAHKAGISAGVSSTLKEKRAESSPLEKKETNDAAKQEEQAPVQTVSSGGKTVSQVAKEAMPSVVAITNMMRYKQNGFSLFGNYQSKETEVPASGSGVIIGKTEEELLIATNNHVVTDSNSLSVTFVDNSAAVNAAVKGTDAAADIAVLAVKLSDIPAETMEKIKVIAMGDSDQTEVGDQVVAIGNALGYGQSVTTGIISAKDRDVETEEGTETGLMQTDAAINPGNSGGALLNMNGELIGINVAKYSDTDVEGMGYSIPSDKAKQVIENLSTLQTRDIVPENERGYLGVQVKNIDKKTAESFGMPQGVFIYKFAEGSSAENSGLQEKDIITKLDGQGVQSYDDLQALLSKYRAGETVKVTVQRQDGSGKYVETEVEVKLGHNSTSPSDQGGSSRSQNPFEKPNKGNDAPENNEGNGDAQNPEQELPKEGGGESSPSDEELWEQFRQFFDQYQR